MTTSSYSRFTIGLTVGLVVGMMLLFSVYYVPRKGFHPFREGLTFHVHFAEANGLYRGDPVLLNGLEVGEVRDVTLETLSGLGIRCVVTVELFDRERHGPFVRYDSVYSVSQEGLLGRRALQIVAGGTKAPLEPEAVVPGSEPRSMEKTLEDLQFIISNLRRLVDAEQPGTPNLQRIMRDLEGTIRNLRDFSAKLPH